MLFTVYGSCQAEAVARSLLIFPEFNERFDYVKIPTCFDATGDQLEYVCSEIIPRMDLFIHQNIGSEYRGYEFSSQNITGHLKSGCIEISLQYLHWEGYQPFHYAFDINAKRCPYSDYLIMQFIEGNMGERDYMRRLSEIVDFINKNIHVITNWCSAQLEMRSRHKSFDICLTDFIKENWLEVKLFHTMNHPTAMLLFKTAELIIELLSIKKTGVKFKDVGRFDPLDIYRLPVFCDPFFGNVNNKSVFISGERFQFDEYIKLEFDEIAVANINLKARIESFLTQRSHLSDMFNSLVG